MITNQNGEKNMPQEQTTTLANLRNIPATSSDTTPVNVTMDTVQGFEAMQRIAKLFASSDIVPARFKGNISNSLIAVDMAMRLRANPLSVMQSLYVVHGTPAWSAKFLIATFNKCGRFSAIRYAFQGEEGKDSWGCRAVTTELATGEQITGPLVTIELAKSEGWYAKSGSKWQTIPELMLRYRSAAWMVNTYAPEIAMGLATAEEREDVYDLEQTQPGVYQISVDDIRRPKQEEQQEEKKTRKRNAKAQEDISEEQARETTFGQMLEEDLSAHDSFDASDAQYLITCPNTESRVDERDCAAKSCRQGCPAFE